MIAFKEVEEGRRILYKSDDERSPFSFVGYKMENYFVGSAGLLRIEMNSNEMVTLIDTCEMCEHLDQPYDSYFHCPFIETLLKSNKETFHCSNFKEKKLW